MNEDKWKAEAEKIVDQHIDGNLFAETRDRFVEQITLALATAAQVQPGHVRTEDGEFKIEYQQTTDDDVSGRCMTTIIYNTEAALKGPTPHDPNSADAGQDLVPHLRPQVAFLDDAHGQVRSVRIGSTHDHEGTAEP